MTRTIFVAVFFQPAKTCDTTPMETSNKRKDDCLEIAQSSKNSCLVFIQANLAGVGKVPNVKISRYILNREGGVEHIIQAISNFMGKNLDCDPFFSS